MLKKKSVMMVLMLGLLLVIVGCASIDIRVDRVDYDCCYNPRISLEQVRVLDKEPGSKFFRVADYIVQEETDILLPRSMNEVIDYAKKKAWNDGCEAILIRDADTTNLTYSKPRNKGVVSRDRPKVKITGYRVKIN